MLHPSDAHLWVPCPLAGQMLASGDYQVTTDPDRVGSDDTDSRREGTCAGWVAELCLNDNDGPVSPYDLVGTAHANGWVVDQEMADHVSDYLAYIESFGDVAAAEVPIQLFELINGRTDATSSDSTEVLRVFELKYGWRLVAADENWPMLCYGLAMWKWPQRIELHIFQPRPNHPEGPARVWTIEPDQVSYWMTWLYERASDCFVYPQGKPGFQCNHCPARGPCHALDANVYAQFEVITDDRMTDHSGERMKAYVQFLRLAKALVSAKLDAIENEAIARIKRAMFVPGLAIEPKKGNRIFTVERDRVRMATGIDPVKAKPMTPAELERAGAPKHVVAQITHRPTTGWKLTDNPEAIANRLYGKPKETT